MTGARYSFFCSVLLGILCIFSSSIYAQDFEQHAKMFLASPESGGNQNALSDYIVAFENFDLNLYMSCGTFKVILENGWTGTEKKEMQVLNTMQPVLNEIVKGNQKPFVRYPPVISAESPVPNFLKYKSLGKCLVLTALYSEHINRPDLAIEWYKHSLIFAQRTCGEHSTLISKLISVALAHIALENYQRFLLRSSLTKEQYHQISADLQTVLSEMVPLWKFFDTEFRLYEQALQKPGSAMMILMASPNMSEDKIEHLAKEVESNKDSIVQQFTELKQKILTALQQSYPEILNTDFESVVAQYHPIFKNMLPNYKEAMGREATTVTNWNLTITTVRILAYRKEKGALPATLDKLSDIALNSPPDPFSTQPFRYSVKGNTAILYSIGPDLMDNQGQVVYDSKQGTISPGDISITIR